MKQYQTTIVKYSKAGLFVFAVIFFTSCKKNWIEARSNKSLVVPSVVKDYQALVGNTGVMNDNHPAFGEMSADDYFIPYSYWQAWYGRNAYAWLPDVYNGLTSDNPNWNYSYRQVFYANIVLDGIDKVSAGELNTPAWKNVKGSAFYFRADAFFNLSQLFTKPYSASVTDADLGIPLRLNADPNVPSVRAGLPETYAQILEDLHGAAAYLPVKAPYKTYPSLPAAYALLARAYLVMHDYSRALKYADSSLLLYNELLDYNTLDAAATYPIPALNKEIIFQCTIADEPRYNEYFVDSVLYQSYESDDLRKILYFKLNANGYANFIGTYTGGTASNVSRAFGGIATDEVYLTRAECFARAGNISRAMDDLNALLIKRWKTGTFIPLTAATAGEALSKILQERRKETLFRGLRWVDLRRLNAEGANITLTRNLNGQLYTLPPNDPRYVLPFPPNVIALTGMPQNPR